MMSYDKASPNDKIGCSKSNDPEFLEQWPEANIDCCGVLTICPSPISTSHRNAYGGCANIGVKCPDCRRKFWMQEVE